MNINKQIVCFGTLVSMLVSAYGDLYNQQVIVRETLENYRKNRLERQVTNPSTYMNNLCSDSKIKKFRSFGSYFSFMSSSLYSGRNDYLSLDYNSKLPFRFYNPNLKQASTKKYPLLVFLHGSFRRGRDNSAQISGSGAILARNNFQKKYPSYVLVPQCPQKQSWNSSIGDAVISLVKELLRKDHNIDKNRVYVMGHSLGGYGVCYLLEKQKGLFAGAVPIAGALDNLEYTSRSLVPIRVCYGTGEVFTVKNASIRLASKFSTNGVDAKPIMLLNSDHSQSLRRTIKNDGVMRWLFRQKRN